MQKGNERPNDDLTQDEEALREKLLNDGDETNLDRSVARDGEFGGGFGEGHYTGTSWDPEINPQDERDLRAKSEQADESHRTPNVHDEDYGAAGAGKFGGTKARG